MLYAGEATEIYNLTIDLCFLENLDENINISRTWGSD